MSLVWKAVLTGIVLALVSVHATDDTTTPEPIQCAAIEGPARYGAGFDDENIVHMTQEFPICVTTPTTTSSTNTSTTVELFTTTVTTNSTSTTNTTVVTTTIPRYNTTTQTNTTTPASTTTSSMSTTTSNTSITTTTTTETTIWWWAYTTTTNTTTTQTEKKTSTNTTTSSTTTSTNATTSTTTAKTTTTLTDATQDIEGIDPSCLVPCKAVHGVFANTSNSDDIISVSECSQPIPAGKWAQCSADPNHVSKAATLLRKCMPNFRVLCPKNNVDPQREPFVGEIAGTDTKLIQCQICGIVDDADNRLMDLHPRQGKMFVHLKWGPNTWIDDVYFTSEIWEEFDGYKIVMIDDFYRPVTGVLATVPVRNSTYFPCCDPGAYGVSIYIDNVPSTFSRFMFVPYTKADANFSEFMLPWGHHSTRVWDRINGPEVKLYKMRAELIFTSVLAVSGQWSLFYLDTFPNSHEVMAQSLAAAITGISYEQIAIMALYPVPGFLDTLYCDYMIMTTEFYEGNTIDGNSINIATFNQELADRASYAMQWAPVKTISLLESRHILRFDPEVVGGATGGDPYAGIEMAGSRPSARSTVSAFLAVGFALASHQFLVL